MALQRHASAVPDKYRANRPCRFYMGCAAISYRPQTADRKGLAPVFGLQEPDFRLFCVVKPYLQKCAFLCNGVQFRVGIGLAPVCGAVGAMQAYSIPL